MKKFEFTGETKVVFGKTLYRIRALVKIETEYLNVNPGDLGGWIEKEENLSHNGNAWVYGDARVYGDAWVYGNARVYGNAWVYGDARVYGNAEVNKKEHILTIGPIGSRNDITTFFRTKNNLIKVKCGCFTGTIDEFLAKVELTHKDSKHAKVYKIATELAIAQIELENE